MELEPNNRLGLTADTGIAKITLKPEFARMHTFCRAARHFMNLTRIKLVIFCLTILIGPGTITRSAGAQTGSHLDLDFNRVPWTHLSFHAKNFWVEVSTDIQLRSRAATELDAVLLASPQGKPVKLKKSQAAELTINTIIDPRFRSPVKIYNRIWFDPTGASALGRIRLRRGEDDFKKMYRFTDRGVFRHRIEPRDKKEASLAPEKWTDIKDSFYPYDMNHLKCTDVTERSLLIYILSAAATKRFDTGLSLCVFGKRQLHHILLKKQGIHTEDVNYIEKNNRTQKQEVKTVKAVQIGITAETAASEQKEMENFSFFGFHKDISVCIDPVTHLPIKASGVLPMVGKVDLKLQSVISK
jgi:hypothetical protein